MLVGRGHMRRTPRVVVGGFTVDAWLQMWFGSHAMTQVGMQRVAWPDGRSLLEQPAIVVSVFSVISSLVSAEADRKT